MVLDMEACSFWECKYKALRKAFRFRMVEFRKLERALRKERQRSAAYYKTIQKLKSQQLGE